MDQPIFKNRFLSKDTDTLIKGCQKHDMHCQHELYKLCYPEMIKVCSRYASDDDGAGIIFNNAMLKVFKYIHQYKEEGKLMGWVKKIVINCSIDYCKGKNIFNQPLHAVSEDEFFIGPEVFDRISGKEIFQLIKRLPASTATVFNLYIYEGFTHKQIGELLGISDGTSKWHVSEGKRLLKVKLEQISKTELKTNAAG